MSVGKTAADRWPGPLVYLSLIALTAFLDLASKHAMIELLDGGTRAISLLPYLDLRLSYNRGISFSLFEAEHTGHLTLLILLTSLATVAFTIAGLVAQSPTERMGFPLFREEPGIKHLGPSRVSRPKAEIAPKPGHIPS